MEPTLQIFESLSGHPSIKLIFEDDTVKHIHSTVAPEKEYTFFKDIHFENRNIIFLGFGAGYHILDKIEIIPTDSNLIIIDYFEELTENAKNNLFSTFNIQTINKNSRSSEIKSILSNIENYQIIKHPASYNALPQFYDEILTKISFTKDLPQKNNLKIMLLHNTFFLEDEILNAIEKSDKSELIKFSYRNSESAYQFENRLFNFIQREKPDLIISVNCKGLDGEGYLLKISKQFNIPVALWFVDDPHPILLNQKQFINDSIYAFCWERSFIPFLNKFNFKKVTYLPLACDPNLFSFNLNNKPATKIGFIGSSMGEDFLNQIKVKFMWNDSLQPLVEKCANTFINKPTQNSFDILSEVINQNNMRLPFSDERNITWLCSYIIHTASMLSRKDIILSLKDQHIELFGDPEGWGKIVGNDFTFHPNIDYRQGLCNAYQDIGININITSRQMATAVNQRVFDIPMSGSFIISDNQEDIGQLFEIEKEAIVYNSISDLKDKISYYKSDQKLREQISLNAKYRILIDHTYTNRLNKIISEIF